MAPQKSALILAVGMACTATTAAYARGPKVTLEVEPETASGAEQWIFVRGGGREIDARSYALEVTAGEVGDGRASDDGIAYPYRAPSVAAETNVTVTVRHRNRRADDATIRVAPASIRNILRSEGPFDIEVPSRVVLGRDESVPISLRASGVADVVLAVAPGRLEVVGMDGGRLNATYFPPADRYPRAAIIVAASRDGSRADLASFALSGVPTIQTKSEPRAQVYVDVAAETFGPFAADARGAADIRIIVPPGVHDASVRSQLGDDEQLKVVPLRVRPRASVVAVCPGDGDAMWVAHAGTNGQLQDKRFHVSADGQPLHTRGRVAPGFYRVPYGDTTPREIRVALASALLETRCIVGDDHELLGREPPERDASSDEAMYRPLGLAVQGGMVTNFGALIAPAVTTQLMIRLPPPADGLRLGANAGFFGTMLSGEDKGETIEGSLWSVPVLARVAYELAVEPVTPFVAVQGGVFIVSSRLSSSSFGEHMQTDVPFAFSGVVGGAIELGPGHALLEASYSYASLDNVVFSGQIGGLGISGGYGYEF